MDAEVGHRQQDKRLSPGSGSAEFLRLTVNSISNQQGTTPHNETSGHLRESIFI